MNDRHRAVLEAVPSDARVLHVECASGFDSDEWLHGLLTTRHPDVVGIDSDGDSVFEIDMNGYDGIVHATPGSFAFDEVFEAIVGDLVLDRLSNPGGFLGRCAANLRVGGRLVLTVSAAGAPADGQFYRFDEDAAASLLEDNGFYVAEADEIMPRTALWHALAGRWPDARWLLVVARPLAGKQ